MPLSALAFKPGAHANEHVDGNFSAEMQKINYGFITRKNE